VDKACSARQLEVREISYINQTHKALPFRIKATRPRPNQRQRERERRVNINIATLFRFPFSVVYQCPSSLTFTPSSSSASIPLSFFFRVRVLTPQWHFHPHSPLQNLRPCSSNPRLPLPHNFLQGRHPRLFPAVTEEPSFGEGLSVATLSPLMHRLVPIMLPLSPLLSSSRLLLLIVSPDYLTFCFIAFLISLIRHPRFSHHFDLFPRNSAQVCRFVFFSLFGENTLSVI